jgi:hypothetical protein
MSRKWIGVLAVMAAAGGIAAGATAVLGQGSQVERPGVKTLDVHVSGSNAAAASAARASGKTKITYPSSGAQVVPGDEQVLRITITKCPRKSKVLNGTFETDGFTVPLSSFPLGKRGWAIDLANGDSPNDYNATFGLVCAKSSKK